MRCGINRKLPHCFRPGFGFTREWKSDTVVILFYMIQYGVHDRKLDIDQILYLMADWYAEDYMGSLQIFHKGESYSLKYQTQGTNDTKYMNALSVEQEKNYYKATEGEIKSLIIRHTWEVVSSKYLQ